MFCDENFKGFRAMSSGGVLLLLKFFIEDETGQNGIGRKTVNSHE